MGAGVETEAGLAAGRMGEGAAAIHARRVEIAHPRFPEVHATASARPSWREGSERMDEFREEA